MEGDLPGTPQPTQSLAIIPLHPQDLHDRTVPATTMFPAERVISWARYERVASEQSPYRQGSGNVHRVECRNFMAGALV